VRVAVLTPPRVHDVPPDREDTFNQAEQVTEALHALHHEAVTAEYVDHGEGTIATLRRIAPDVVFNLVEDVPEGPDQVHRVTALLDRHGIRYTGAGTAPLVVLADKAAMRAGLAAAGLPHAAGLDEPGGEDRRFIVKSLREHGSEGLDASSVVHGAAAARRLVAERQARGSEWFAEAYIEGREFDLSLLDTPDGPLVLPPAEITFGSNWKGPRIFDYHSKWVDEVPDAEGLNRIFPPREEPLFSELGRLAVATWRHFGINGFAHVDFRVDADGRPFIIDVNANPCIARVAGFCEAAARVGLSQTDVVAALLAAA
jgi:D-alanine-D-alanine ligase